jgi:hypothetical protein
MKDTNIENKKNTDELFEEKVKEASVSINEVINEVHKKIV